MIETYRHLRSCPKCGGKDISDSYCGPGQPFILCKSRYDSVHKEHIRRYCRRCGYQWDEAPIDTTAAANEG